MKRSLLILTFLAALTFSCSDEDNSNNLDVDLRAALTDASNGEGLSYFILPDENNLSAIPQDPNNPITASKVELGKNLFHETAFATEGEFPNTIGSYSCATCHHAAAGFQAGTAQGLGEGGQGFGLKGEARTRNTLCDASLCDVQPIRSPSAMNGAFQPLMLWNGQFGATS